MATQEHRGLLKEKTPYYVCSLSGGKDSTAMTLRLLEEGYPIDEIVFFDTGMEFPEMYEHIEKVKKVIDRHGVKFTKLAPEKGFEYYLLDYEKPRLDGVVITGFSWPNQNMRWCTKHLKTEVNRAYFKNLSENHTILTYLGIAKDEIKRLERPTHKDKKNLYPLVEWGWTESDCLNYCYSKGYDWGGLYQIFARVSCWCCPLQSIKDLYNLWANYPDLWAKLETWEKQIEYKWSNQMPPFKQTIRVEDLTKRFIIEKQRKEANLSTSSRNFYKAVKFSIKGIDKRQKTLEGY